MLWMKQKATVNLRKEGLGSCGCGTQQNCPDSGPVGFKSYPMKGPWFGLVWFGCGVTWHGFSYSGNTELQKQLGWTESSSVNA